MNYTNYYQNPYQPVVPVAQPRVNQMDMQYPQYSQQIYQQSQMQQMQPQIPIQSGINGRIVNDINTVNIDEVSKDNNNPSVFLKNDLSEMYLKRYNSNGLIQTFTYKLQVDEAPTKDENNSKSWQNEFEFLQEQLNVIDEKLSKVLSTDDVKPSRQKSTSSKKEVE